MILQAKTFDELSKEELFAILRARQDVFVVEQECAYHDIDDIDLSCVHGAPRTKGAIHRG